MAKEIERKFLVKGSDWKQNPFRKYLHQGYLNSEKERTVRVRVSGGEAFITIKGITVGATRQEFEYGIPKTDAEILLKDICEKPTIEKYRYFINHEGFTWEVDEFLGENEGLVVAEVELEDENQQFKKPSWLGEEVTGDPKYYNANLVAKPFKYWK